VPVEEPSTASKADKVQCSKKIAIRSLRRPGKQIVGNLDAQFPEDFQSRYLPGFVSVNATQSVAAAAATLKTKNPGK
jgi:hypothetical protein